MTSKFNIDNRELLQRISSGEAVVGIDFGNLIVRELAAFRLSAMDSSESVELPLDYLQGHKDGLEWAAQLAEANHHETGDWLYDDPIELAKAIRKGPDMPPVQPVADSEPVAWTWQHLKQWHVTNDEERARDLAWDGVKVEPLYRRAQPVPAVPGKWIPVSEQMPENKPGSYEYLVFEKLNNRVNHDYWNCPDAGDDTFTPFWNHYGGYVTHWMPMPAGPQEVK